MHYLLSQSVRNRCHLVIFIELGDNQHVPRSSWKLFKWNCIYCLSEFHRNGHGSMESTQAEKLNSKKYIQLIMTYLTCGWLNFIRLGCFEVKITGQMLLKSWKKKLLIIAYIFRQFANDSLTAYSDCAFTFVNFMLIIFFLSSFCPFAILLNCCSNSNSIFYFDAQFVCCFFFFGFTSTSCRLKQRMHFATLRKDILRCSI